MNMNNENEKDKEIAALFENLSPNVDYLFCPVCEKHIPCTRNDTGYWEVNCPGCVGECNMCKCYLAKYCFGRREEFPPIPFGSETAE